MTFKGCRLSLEQLRKMQEGRRRMGWSGAWWKGKHHSESTKAKISRALKGRPRLKARGKKNHGWKGGIRLDSNGYVLIYSPNHHSRPNRGYIFQHRLVYEEFHRCCLLPWSVIHHIDRNKTNNDPSNLVATSNAKHTAAHFTRIKKICMMCGCDSSSKWRMDDSDNGNGICYKCWRKDFRQKNDWFYRQRDLDLAKAEAVSLMSLDRFIRDEESASVTPIASSLDVYI